VGPSSWNGTSWPRLRKERPEEFEKPVDASLDPAGWVGLWTGNDSDGDFANLRILTMQ